LRFLMPDGKEHRTEAGQVIVYLGADPSIPVVVGQERFKTFFGYPELAGGVLGYTVQPTNISFFRTAGRRALLVREAAEAGLTHSDFMMRLAGGAADLGGDDPRFPPDDAPITHSEARKIVLAGLRLLKAPR